MDLLLLGHGLGSEPFNALIPKILNIFLRKQWVFIYFLNNHTTNTLIEIQIPNFFTKLHVL